MNSLITKKLSKEQNVNIKANCEEVFYVEILGGTSDEDIAHQFALWTSKNEIYSIRTLSTGGGSHYAVYELQHKSDILNWLKEHGVLVRQNIYQNNNK